MALNHVSTLSRAVLVRSSNEPINFTLNTYMGRFPNGSLYTINLSIVILLVCNRDHAIMLYVCDYDIKIKNTNNIGRMLFHY